MKILVLVMAALVLAVPVGANPESITMGPYTVSFDLGYMGGYSITTEQSEKETLYGIPVTDYMTTIQGASPTQVIWLSVKEFRPTMEVEYDTMGAMSDGLKSLSFQCGEPIIIPRTIDGKLGALGSTSCAGGFSVQGILYPLDTPNEVVIIFSGYPWDEGTSNLVKTIHVEKS